MNLKQLREIAAKATQVVSWYPHHSGGDDHGATVRGPFCRWFRVTAVDEQYRKHVASDYDDAQFAAAAMNNLIPLLDLIEEMRAALSRAEDWLGANLNAPTMDCRGDEDCDHCEGITVCTEVRSALDSLKDLEIK